MRSARKMTERIGPEHEGRHLADDDPTFNESSYYNFSAPGTGVTGWVRVGLQHNRRAAQAGILLFLPGGRTLFASESVETDQQESLAAGPLTIDIVAPHRAQRLRWNGEVSEFADARTLVAPRQAFAAAPRRSLRLDLQVSGRGDSLGTDGVTSALEESMARGHYEQFIGMTGTVSVDGDDIAVTGAGLRDHSWGPRDWAAPLRYRWITAAFDDQSQLMLLLVDRRDGSTTREAMQWRDGALRDVQLEDVEDHWTEDGFVQKAVCRIRTEGATEEITAIIMDHRHLTPLRHRRPDGEGGELLTRIGYGAYRFDRGGLSGTGIVESLDQLTDGLPNSMP